MLAPYLLSLRAAVAASPVATAIGAIAILANVWFFSIGAAEYFHIGLGAAIISAIIFISVQLGVGSLARTGFKRLWSVAYAGFFFVNVAFTGGGIVAVVASDELGRISFRRATTQVHAAINTAESAAAQQANAAQSASAIAGQRADSEDRAGSTCPGNPSGSGQGDIYFTRMGDRDRLAALAAATKATADTMAADAAKIDTAITDYRVDTHADATGAIRNAVTEARRAAAKSDLSGDAADLQARLARAKGAAFPGPKTGRSLTCPDPDLASALTSLLAAKAVELDNPELPAKPTLRSAVQGFVEAMRDAILLKGFAWDPFAPGLVGFVPDIFIILAWAQILAHTARKRSVSGTLIDGFGLGTEATWDAVDRAARRTASDPLLIGMEEFHVCANGVDYLAIPIEGDHEAYRHIAETLEDVALATFRGRGRLHALVGKRAEATIDINVVVDVFEIAPRVWRKLRADIRRAGAASVEPSIQPEPVA